MYVARSAGAVRGMQCDRRLRPDARPRSIDGQIGRRAVARRRPASQRASANRPAEPSQARRFQAVQFQQAVIDSEPGERGEHVFGE